MGLAIYEAVTVAISAVVWFPFFKIANKQPLKQEEAENEE